ncbi:MAG: hypothetical protein ACFE7R_09440, partial [Candidatus Hodarchaeota archaeon]
MPELFGVDCELYTIIHLEEEPENLGLAAHNLYEVVASLVRMQLNTGGSTLFFNVERMLTSKSAGLIEYLVKARTRETVLVLDELDKSVSTLGKDWVNVSRLWRTGNGFRLLRAKEVGRHIHLKDYASVRELLLSEIEIKSEDIETTAATLRKRGETQYLALSERLDDFVRLVISSRGIRGRFEPYYRPWVDLEGIDDF